MGKKIKSKSGKLTAKQPAETFEVSLEKLESIVRELESGNLGLTDSLGKYERGIRYLKQCYRLLNQAEKKVQLLTGVDRDGNPVTVDFDDQATTLEPQSDHDANQQPKRSRKPRQNRNNPSESTPDDVDDSNRLF